MSFGLIIFFILFSLPIGWPFSTVYRLVDFFFNVLRFIDLFVTGHTIEIVYNSVQMWRQYEAMHMQSTSV